MAQGRAWNKEKVIEALQPYFELGYSVNKACVLAQVPQSTVQTWIAEDDVLRLKIDAWQGLINAKARQVIKAEIEKGNVQQANWWIERREKDDFSTREEKTGPEGESLFEPLREALMDLTHDTFTTEDPETGQSDVQKRSRRSARTHTDTVHDLRAHIQKALQTGEPQSPHTIREESDSSSSDSNQSSDVS